MKDFLYKWVLITLSLPLILFHLIIHIFEEIQKCHSDFKDKLFMKRFNLIDQKHVCDFIKWNDQYKKTREEE